MLVDKMKTSVIDSFAQFHIIYINLIKSNDVKVKKTSLLCFQSCNLKRSEIDHWEINKS